MGDVSCRFRTLADDVLVVPPVDAAVSVPDQPRSGPDARPRASGTASLQGGIIDSQSIKRQLLSQGRLRRGQEGSGAQAPRGYGRAAADGPPDAGRHLRLRQSPDDPGRNSQALAVAKAPVCRRMPLTVASPHVASGQPWVRIAGFGPTGRAMGPPRMQSATSSLGKAPSSAGIRRVRSRPGRL